MAEKAEAESGVNREGSTARTEANASDLLAPPPRFDEALDVLLRRYAKPWADYRRLGVDATTDVPWLVGEVRRLRELLDAAGLLP